jgi:uncharacterized paraquat-inducible protein A
MARRRLNEEDEFDGEEFDDDEFDGEESDDAEADDDEATMPCPYCGAAIYDDAVRCAVCDEYLNDAERTTTLQPRWVAVTAAIVLAAFLWALLRAR